MSLPVYFDRDISWLSFNERVLQEAGNPNVPLLEKIRFLSIYSSNLDEFYRVRMPALTAVQLHGNVTTERPLDQQATGYIQKQLNLFGTILTQQIIPQLKEDSYYLVYKEPIPAIIKQDCVDYFFNSIAAFIEIIHLSKTKLFFPENNKLYIACMVEQNGVDDIVMIHIPSNEIGRFYSIKKKDINYIVFIDDIIKANLSFLLSKWNIRQAINIKVTRDAELDLQDEYEGDIAEKIEQQIGKRDAGLATRMLYEPGIAPIALQKIIVAFNLLENRVIEGGHYHHLKELSSIPIYGSKFQFPKVDKIEPKRNGDISLLNKIEQKDLLIHTPYNSYHTILRFFGEAAIDADVTEIYVTMYRVANDSRIVHALISAAKNGKKVTVFIELKARFDEANNIKWAKNMKAAGVQIIYSIPGLKVHAKVGLIKKQKAERVVYLGLFSTGNLNETTANFYTDHLLLSANKSITSELELLFIFLAKRRKPIDKNEIKFNHLLVAQFNLQDRFLSLIDREIEHAKNGNPAIMNIKLNNLEEDVLINKLYEASNAGVKINLIVRSICRLVPGINGQNENITVKRIVDKYLEHGRVFWFNNNGYDEIYLGSSDWMNRNIYRRIEVCFPIYNEVLKNEIKTIIDLQLNDNVAAVLIDAELNNIPVINDRPKIRSQDAIYEFVKSKSN